MNPSEEAYNEFEDLPLQDQEIMDMALDSIRPDPHGNDFDITDPIINNLEMNFNNEKTYKKKVIDLADFPDFSDKEITDYLMNKMKGIETLQTPVIDLDTAPNYVDFVNLSIKNMQQFDNQFNEQSVYELLKKKLNE